MVARNGEVHCVDREKWPLSEHFNILGHTLADDCSIRPYPALLGQDQAKHVESLLGQLLSGHVAWLAFSC